MPTRSKPMVSCTPIACAIATLVPMPSVEVASTGCAIAAIRAASKNPANPPMPPSTSGRRVLPTHSFINATARSPASMSTPAAAYADCSFIRGGPSWATRPRWRSGTAEGVHRACAGGHRLQAVQVGADSALPRVLEDVLAQPLAERQLDGGNPVEAGAAERVLADLRRGDQTVERHVAERVGADRAADLVAVQPGGDELRPGGEVDAVEAGPLDGRGGDPHVDLGGAGLAQHPDQGPLGVAADDGVVDDDEALTGDDVAERVQLEPDAELADGLAGLDEGAADVGVLHQTLAIGDSRLLGIPDGGRGPGLRHGDDQVGVRRELAGQRPPDLDPDRVQPAAGDHRFRSRQVDVLEQAPLRLGCGEPAAAEPVAVDGDQLTGRDLPDER